MSRLIEATEHASDHERNAGEPQHDADRQHDDRDAEREADDHQHDSSQNRGGVLEPPVEIVEKWLEGNSHDRPPGYPWSPQTRCPKGVCGGALAALTGMRTRKLLDHHPGM